MLPTILTLLFSEPDMFGRMPMPFSFMFYIVPIFMLFIFGFIIVTIIMRLTGNVKNSRLPVLTVDATLVAKRISLDRRMRNNSDNIGTQYSNYETMYVTFEFESGDRAEYLINQNDYGLLKEGDFGKFTFQGKKFISFERIKN